MRERPSKHHATGTFFYIANWWINIQNEWKSISKWKIPADPPDFFFCLEGSWKVVLPPSSCDRNEPVKSPSLPGDSISPLKKSIPDSLIPSAPVPCMPPIPSGHAKAILPIAPSTDQLDKQKTILTSSAAMLPQVMGMEAGLYYK